LNDITLRAVSVNRFTSYFAYGGSTVIAVFPPGLIKFDQDLVKNSEDAIETLMKVGYSLGTKSSA
jgi:phosphatidylserine decarboxylase